MIRNFEIKDIEEVMDIWLETNKKAHPFIDKKYWENNFENVKNAILEAEVYVYEEEKKVVGFVGVVEGYIAGIFVKENSQNNGIGKILVNKCKEKYNRLNLKVYEKNKKAIQFYLSQGFKIVGKNIDEQNDEIEFAMEWAEC